ncbi:hypothetical protein ACWOFR_03340 [Carnobacterium gallinarum]|uniref:hypothetical protein n=1 Tax=Carnobacterium gallinarum TaxID=2749 RepID=UPI000551B690|nr:hypothetical protein [Carnobacterium gallinarum]
MLNKMLSMIPDAFAKTKESNFGKLFVLLNQQVTDVSSTAEQIESWRSINKAEGVVLDKIGSDLEQYRGLADDEIYRLLIKSRIIRAQSSGTFDDIIQAICATVNCKATDISIIAAVESEDSNLNSDPLAVVIERIPLGALNAIGMNVGTFTKIVEHSVVAGVRVVSINLEGTFEFSENYNDYSEIQGFANDEGTVGGFFGDTYLDDGVDLPI